MTDTVAETEALLALLGRFSIDEFEYRDGSRHIRISGSCLPGREIVYAIPTTVAPPSPETAGPVVVASPGVGRFRAITRDSLPRSVREGECIGFIQTGLVRMPVVSPCTGKLVAIRHEDDTGVGYDTPLFEIVF